MAVTQSTMVFIGTLASMDINEGDWNAENASAIQGTYDSFNGLEIIDITNNDVDNDGAIFDDESGTSDYVTYTRDGTGYNQQVDSSVSYFANVTDVDGVVHNIEVLVVQMQNGDTFVGDYQNLGNLDNLTIRSIELTAPNTTSAAGYNTFQTMSGSTVCFVSGTLIDTDTGPRPVESLRAGHMLQTFDNGLQPVRWVGCSDIAQVNPVCFMPGSLGAGLPTAPLAVSPNHRILARSRLVRRMFGVDEILVPAKRFVGLPGVSTVMAEKSASYWHVAFDCHALIFAQGALTESFYPGPVAMATLPSDQKSKLIDVFQGLDVGRLPSLARTEPAGARQKRFVHRLLRNAHPVVEERIAPLALNTCIGATPGQNATEAARLVQ